jgi:hypothetical protein
MTDNSADRSFPLKCSVKTAHPLSATVTGLARGRAIAVAPQTFIVIPAYLEDYHGLYVAWNEPAPGQPIWTDKHIVSFTDAQHVFAQWAQGAFEQKWAANRERRSAYEVRS